MLVRHAVLGVLLSSPRGVEEQGLRQASGCLEHWSHPLHSVRIAFDRLMANRLCGFPPFYEESTPLLFDQIMSGQYDFPEPYWTPVSDQAKDLIRHMLVVDPRQRYTTQQCLAHPWLSVSTSRLLS
jgi:serine/threonine protein kinase